MFREHISWQPHLHGERADVHQIAGLTAALTGFDYDGFFATDGHCTHEKTLLCDGLVMGGVIECPKHNGRFDYTSGKALGAPVLVDVRTYPVKVVDDTVYIELPQ